MICVTVTNLDESPIPGIHSSSQYLQLGGGLTGRWCPPPHTTSIPIIPAVSEWQQHFTLGHTSGYHLQKAEIGFGRIKGKDWSLGPETFSSQHHLILIRLFSGYDDSYRFLGRTSDKDNFRDLIRPQDWSNLGAIFIAAGTQIGNEGDHREILVVMPPTFQLLGACSCYKPVMITSSSGITVCRISFADYHKLRT